MNEPGVASVAYRGEATAAGEAAGEAAGAGGGATGAAGVGVASGRSASSFGNTLVFLYVPSSNTVSWSARLAYSRPAVDSLPYRSSSVRPSLSVTFTRAVASARPQVVGSLAEANSSA